MEFQGEPSQAYRLHLQELPPGGNGEQISPHDTQMPVSNAGFWSSLPNLSATAGVTKQASKKARPVAEATFTPTAAGLHPAEAPAPELSVSMQLIIADAIRQGIAAGMQQTRRAPSITSGFSLDPGLDQADQLPREVPAFPEPYSPTTSQRSQSLLSGEEGQKDMELSEDEGLIPDHPIFTGLFLPVLFKSLLFKALIQPVWGWIILAQIQLWLHWTPLNPASQNRLQRLRSFPHHKCLLAPILPPVTRFYSVGPELTRALQIPAVDAPVAVLQSSLAIPGDPEESLKADDKRGEQMLQRSHLCRCHTQHSSSPPGP